MTKNATQTKKSKKPTTTKAILGGELPVHYTEDASGKRTPVFHSGISLSQFFAATKAPGVKTMTLAEALARDDK